MDEGAILTPHMPSPAEVVAMLARSYREPKLLQVTMHWVRIPNIVDWERTYDGIRVDVVPRSARQNGGWCTRFRRELGEPQRARRSALISSNDAIAKSGVEVRGVELVYVPTYRNLQKPGTAGNNTDDFELVIERMDLLYVISGTDGGTVHVDPYSGAIKKRIKPPSCFGP